MKTRSLKIEVAGDPKAGVPFHPKIRIAGQWLERAGFTPGARVQIFCANPGTLTLQIAQPSQAVAPQLS